MLTINQGYVGRDLPRYFLFKKFKTLTKFVINEVSSYLEGDIYHSFLNLFFTINQQIMKKSIYEQHLASMLSTGAVVWHF